MNGGWSDWAQFPYCCGGKSRLYRACNNPRPAKGGANCIGDNVKTVDCHGLNKCPGIKICLFIYINSVLRPFKDYFSSYETGQSEGGRKPENLEKNHLAHPQAELGFSHMWPVRGSNPRQTQR